MNGMKKGDKILDHDLFFILILGIFSATKLQILPKVFILKKLLVALVGILRKIEYALKRLSDSMFLFVTLCKFLDSYLYRLFLSVEVSAQFNTL